MINEYDKKDADVNERINQINKRITDLYVQRGMWARAGGMGYSMAMKALKEIEDLEILKSDLLNGTHNREINNLKDELNFYQSELDNAFGPLKLLYLTKIKKILKKIEYYVEMDSKSDVNKKVLSK